MEIETDAPFALYTVEATVGNADYIVELLASGPERACRLARGWLYHKTQDAAAMLTEYVCVGSRPYRTEGR